MEAKPLRLTLRGGDVNLVEKFNELLTGETQTIAQAPDDRLENGSASRLTTVGGTMILYGLSLGLAYLFNVLVARWAGPEQFGRYIIVWNLISWAVTPASLGTSSAAIRYIPQFEYTNSRELLAGFLIFSAAATALTSATLGALGAFSGAKGLFPVLGSLGPMLVPFLILIVSGSLGNLATEVARAGRNPWMAVAPQSVIRPLLALCGLVLVGDALKSGTTATQVVDSLAISSSVVLVWQCGYLWIRFSDLRRQTIRFDIRSWLSTSSSLCLFTIVVTGLMQLDTLLVGILIGPKAAGMFGVDYRIYLVMEIPIVIANMLALPRLSGRFANRDMTEVQSEMTRVSRTVFWSATALATAIAALHGPILALFGHEFLGARAALYWLAGAAVTSAIFGPVSFLAAVMDLQKIGLAILCATAAVDVVGNLVLVPTWGITGGAMAYFASNLFRAIAFYIVIRRRWGLYSAAFF